MLKIKRRLAMGKGSMASEREQEILRKGWAHHTVLLRLWEGIEVLV